MDQQGQRLLGFGQFRMDVAKRVVYSDKGKVLPLKAKAFDTLLYLVQHPGRVIEREELLNAIWPDTVVEENNLTQHISALRRMFGEKPEEHRYIATIPGHGYKFVAEVRVVDATDDATATSSSGLKADSRPISSPRPRIILLVAAVILGLGAVGVMVWRGDGSPVADEPIRTLAVLPFKPLVDGARDESLELGMADSMIAKLSGGVLTVRPLAAVRRFNDIDQDPLAAGRGLGVEAVLDGSIQIANDRVRISAKLLRVSDGKQLWADQYNADSDDIFSLQDSISERVAAALPVALAATSRKNYTSNVEAYQLFAKGRLHSLRLIRPEVEKGIAYFEQAIAVDPNYALAYVEVANACRALVLTSDVRPHDIMPKAQIAARRAADLDPTLAEAHSALALTAFWYEFDPQRAESLLLKALELDPRSPQSHFGYAHLLSNTGRHDEALVAIKRAREIDPASLVTNALEGQILFFAGRDDEALRALDAVSEMDSNFWLPELFKTRVFIKREMWDEALASAAKARDLSGGNAEAIATIAYIQARAGKTSEARATIAELEKRVADRYVPAYGLAAAYYGLGERSKALNLLERSFAERDALMVFLKVDLKWDGLRQEPSFVELMKKMNFDQSNTSVRDH